MLSMRPLTLRTMSRLRRSDVSWRAWSTSLWTSSGLRRAVGLSSPRTSRTNLSPLSTFSKIRPDMPAREPEVVGLTRSGSVSVITLCRSSDAATGALVGWASVPRRSSTWLPLFTALVMLAITWLARFRAPRRARRVGMLTAPLTAPTRGRPKTLSRKASSLVRPASRASRR